VAEEFTEPAPRIIEHLRVERGVPTDEELAAIVGVLLTASGRLAGAPPAAPASRWAASARPGGAFADGRPVRPGADGWRSFSLPRS
jgi:hypothetical protein